MRFKSRVGGYSYAPLERAVTAVPGIFAAGRDNLRENRELWCQGGSFVFCAFCSVLMYSSVSVLCVSVVSLSSLTPCFGVIHDSHHDFVDLVFPGVPADFVLFKLYTVLQ